MADDPFLATILQDPSDRDARLIYADWLEEQEDETSAAKAEFLRLTVELSQGRKKSAERKEKEQRLQRLAAGLDTRWLAVVSRLPIENCQNKSASAEPPPVLRFGFQCDRRWEELQVTDDVAVRFCEGCEQKVYYCETIGDARKHANVGHCVAVDAGIVRRQGDLFEPEARRLGKVLPNSRAWKREMERRTPDPVSAERERRRSERQGSSGESTNDGS